MSQPTEDACLQNWFVVGADLRALVPLLLGVQRGTVGDASSARSRSQAHHMRANQLLAPAFHFPAFLLGPSFPSSLSGSIGPRMAKPQGESKRLCSHALEVQRCPLGSGPAPDKVHGVGETQNRRTAYKVGAYIAHLHHEHLQHLSRCSEAQL